MPTNADTGARDYRWSYWVRDRDRRPNVTPANRRSNSPAGLTQILGECQQLLEVQAVQFAAERSIDCVLYRSAAGNILCRAEKPPGVSRRRFRSETCKCGTEILLAGKVK